MNDRMDEILQRLDAIERRLQDHEREHHDSAGPRHWAPRDDGSDHRGHRCRCQDRPRHHHGHDCHCHGHHDRGVHDHRGGDGFDEKRVVDLIVDLVAERVERLMQRYQFSNAPPSPDAQPPRG